MEALGEAARLNVIRGWEKEMKYNPPKTQKERVFSMAKTLVAYFSASGVTARVARALASAAGADLYEIRPQQPYTAADLDWNNKKSRSTLEMTGRMPHPALADHDANVAAYDRILLGFPIWWGVAPTVVNSFLEAYDFTGKEIALFATSGGSGLGRTAAALAPSCPGAEIRVGASRLFNSRVQLGELKAWAESI